MLSLRKEQFAELNRRQRHRAGTNGGVATQLAIAAAPLPPAGVPDALRIRNRQLKALRQHGALLIAAPLSTPAPSVTDAAASEGAAGERRIGRLRVRRRQYANLAGVVANGAVQRLVDHCRTRYPIHPPAQDPQTLRAWVKQGVRRAAAYGIVAEEDLQSFLGLRVMFGDSFDDDPRCAWAAVVLWDPALSGTQKMDSLIELAPHAPRPSRPSQGTAGEA
jgi:hypothetical protein